MRTRWMATGAAVALAATPLLAADGVLIVQKVTNGTTTTTSQSQIEKTRMRSEITTPAGRKQIVLFDGAAQVLRIIDEQAKTYSEISNADAERLRSQFDGAMTQMQEQMKSMPPEQRARMEAMIKARSAGMAAAAGPPPSYKKVGTDRVGKWPCDKYEGTKNGEKVSEVCAAGPAVLGFAAGEFEVTRQLGEFFSSTMPQAGDGLFALGSGQNPNAFPGLPLRVVTFRAGATGAVSEVTDASRQNFPDTLFQVPAGYEKREFPGAGRGRGRQQ